MHALFSGTSTSAPSTEVDPTAQRQLLSHVWQLIGDARFDVAASVLANSLQSHYRAAHVAVGLRRRGGFRVVAWSGAAQPSAERGVLRVVAAAMDEAAEQQAVLCFPPPADQAPYITLRHADLHAERLGGALCSLPLPAGQQVVGALTLVRAGDHPFTPAERQNLAQLARLLGPLLQLKTRSEDSALVRIGRDLRGLGQRLRSPGHWGTKLTAGALLTALVGGAFVPVPVNVTASARLEGVLQRSLAAPYDGFLERVLVRPGDAVKQGQVMASLATEDLQNEQRRLQSEVARHRAEAGDALAREDRGAMVVAQARAAEAAAQLALIDQQIQRAQVVAPFDGVVIRGDLHQQVGAPVQRGEVMMVVAPSAAYRIVLDIDDLDAGRVRDGMGGWLALSARPDQAHAIRLQRVTPLARVVDGRNVFEAQAELLDAANGLRPGLEGFAKLELERQPLIAMLWERCAGWLRFVAWKHLG